MSAILDQANKLVRDRRWGCLAVTCGEVPLAAWVAYAFGPDLKQAYFHLSRLAQHTNCMLANPKVSLAITAPETAGMDPQLLPRISLQGVVTALRRDDADYPVAKDIYLRVLPDAEPRFEFQDFVLFDFRVTGARFIAGFGSAHTLNESALERCSAQ